MGLSRKQRLERTKAQASHIGYVVVKKEIALLQLVLIVGLALTVIVMLGLTL